MLRLFIICLALAACHSTPAPPPPYRPIGSELFQNPVFAAWTKGTPRNGTYKGAGAIEEARGDVDGADHWVAKFTVSPTSKLVASKDPAGMRYDFTASQPESFYARQYLPHPEWFYGKTIRLTAKFTCSLNVTRVWFYLHFRWNRDQEDNPGVTGGASGPASAGILTADVVMPSGNPGYALDASAGFVPSFNMDIGEKGWCVINSMSAKQI